MYFWKCWYDSRARFLTCVSVISGLMILLAHFMGRHISERGLDQFWGEFASVRTPLGGFFLPITAIVIAASAVGEEFAIGTAGFVFTRPRKRRTFVWTSWATGMLEMVGIIVAPVLCGFLVGLYYAHRVTSWRFLSIFAYVLPVTAVVYGFAHLAALLGRGARRGTGITTLALLLYIGTEVLLIKHGIQPPHWWLDQLSSAPHAGYSAVLPICGWLAFSLLFPFAEQCIVERFEI